MKMFKKRKEKKRDPITDEEYRRLVELERQHGPQDGPKAGGGGSSVGQTPSSSSTPRAFKFSKRKDRVRVLPNIRFIVETNVDPCKCRTLNG